MMNDQQFEQLLQKIAESMAMRGFSEDELEICLSWASEMYLGFNLLTMINDGLIDIGCSENEPTFTQSEFGKKIHKQILEASEHDDELKAILSEIDKDIEQKEQEIQEKIEIHGIFEKVKKTLANKNKINPNKKPAKKKSTKKKSE